MVKKFTFSKMVYYTAIILVMLFQMLPILVLVVASFGAEGYLAFPPKNYSLKWYEEFYNSTAFTSAYIISLELAAATTIASLFLGTITAYAIDRSAYRRSLTVFFGSPLMLPALVIGLALLQWFRMIGIGTGLIALFIGQLVITMPYVIRGCLSALYRFNITLEEAAQTLGCNRIKTFCYITVPIMKRSLIASGCFVFIISFGHLAISIFLASARVAPLPVRLYAYATFTPDPIIAAISTCTLVMTLIFVLFIERTSGINEI